MTESARAEAFASQADRSRELAEGYVRQAMQTARQIRDLRDTLSRQLAAYAIPHRWVDYELQLLSPETGEWLSGPSLRGARGVGLSNAAVDEDDHLILTFEDGVVIDAGQLPAAHDGDNAYVYIAYASNGQGADFSADFVPSLDYVAIRTSTVPIEALQASDFEGLWKNYRGLPGNDGGHGWTQVLAAVADGERRVHQIVDWVGGSGTKPAIGQYVGASGPVDTVAEAVDMRGATGASGSGTGDMQASTYDPTGKAADAFSADNHTDGTTKKVFTADEREKLGNINVTAAVDLDAIEARVVELDAVVVLKGSWSAAGGSFPGSGAAKAGESWIVSAGGVVDGVSFNANDRLIAIADNASTLVFADNWFKADYTDQVLSVDAETGAITVGAIIAGAATKATPADADALAISDSAAEGATKKTLWSNIKATLKAYFDTLYQPKPGGWTQVGSTQNASNSSSISFGSIGNYSELYLDLSAVSLEVPTPGEDDNWNMVASMLEWSIDGGSTWYGQDGPAERVTFLLTSYVNSEEGSSDLYGAALIKRSSGLPWGTDQRIEIMAAYDQDQGGDYIAGPPPSSTWPHRQDLSVGATRIYAPTEITNLRVTARAFGYDFSEGEAQFQNIPIISGSFKLYKR